MTGVGTGNELREYLRAAQAAELDGNRLEAARLLEAAAALYDANGSRGRADGLRRHAEKLRAETPAQAPRPSAEPQWIERGPTLADPTQDAWCSFCCRPNAEVGRLVAGPAGAFVCAACVEESASLLGRAPLSAPTGPVAPSSTEPFSRLSEEHPDLADAWFSAQEAFSFGCRCVALVGAPGAPVRMALEQLQELGWGAWETPGGDRAAWGLRRGGQLLLGAIGSLPEPALRLRQPDGRRLAWFSPDALASLLGAAWAAQVDRVVVLHPSSLPESLLHAAASRALKARGRGAASPSLLEACVRFAARNGLGPAQLARWVATLPPGDWDLEEP